MFKGSCVNQCYFRMFLYLHSKFQRGATNLIAKFLIIYNFKIYNLQTCSSRYVQRRWKYHHLISINSLKYLVINKKKKYNFLYSFTSVTELFHEKCLALNSNKKKFSRPNNANFWYFADETIIKTCTKVHFVVNLSLVSSHIWLHWPDFSCF